MTSHTASGALLITLAWLVAHGQARFLHNESPDYDNNEIEASSNKSNPHRDLAAIPALDPRFLLNLPFGLPPGLSEDILGAPITQEDFNSNSRDTLQNNITDGTKIDPLELAGAFEGDIILATPDEFLLRTQPGNDSLSRRAVRQSVKTWRNGVIPCFFSSHYSSTESRIITAGMNNFLKNSCIKFVHLTNQQDYINIYKGNGCWSNSVGRVGGTQFVSLDSRCLKGGYVMLPLMRVAGVSTVDYGKLNRLYKCPKRSGPAPAAASKVLQVQAEQQLNLP